MKILGAMRQKDSASGVENSINSINAVIKATIDQQISFV